MQLNIVVDQNEKYLHCVTIENYTIQTVLQQRGFQAQNLSFKASIHNILRIFINYSLSILLLKSLLWLFLVLFYFQFHSKLTARRLTQYTG